MHEIGHFLGLGHPDNVPDNWMRNLSWSRVQGPGTNSYQAALAAGARVNASNCLSLWEGVRPGVPPGAALEVASSSSSSSSSSSQPAGYPHRDSIMEAFTQNNPRVCLEVDDLEALSVLYPDCTGTSLSEVVCTVVEHRIGATRIALHVLLPLLLSFVFIILCSGCVSAYQRRAVDEARGESAAMRLRLAVTRLFGPTTRPPAKHASNLIHSGDANSSSDHRL